MKQIVKVRIIDNEIVLFQTADGVIYNKQDLVSDILFRGVVYNILTTTGFKEIKLDKNEEIEDIKIEELTNINNL